MNVQSSMQKKTFFVVVDNWPQKAGYNSHLSSPISMDSCHSSPATSSPFNSAVNSHQVVCSMFNPPRTAHSRSITNERHAPGGGRRRRRLHDLYEGELPTN